MSNTGTDLEKLITRGISDGTQAFTGPEHVVIDLTNRCNNNCICCWTKSPLLGDNRPAPTWHSQQLETEIVLQLINELSVLGTKIIRFTGGGEPFLHQDIIKLITAVKSHNMYCAVTTSLNMIDREGIDRVIDTGLDELSVSLWASNSAEYTATHPNKSEDTFKRITSVLKRVSQKKRKSVFSLLKNEENKGPRVNILNVISKANHTGIVDMYEYALNIRADSIYFTVVDIIEGSTDSLLLSSDDRLLVNNACKHIAKRNRTLLGNQRIFLDNFEGFLERINETSAQTGQYDKIRVENIPCYIGWLFCRIMADGQVAPCCRGVNIPMGDLHHTSFSDIWFSENYNRFRTMAKNIHQNRSYFEKVGCGKTCDNHMHNLDMHRRLFGSEK